MNKIDEILKSIANSEGVKFIPLLILTLIVMFTVIAVQPVTYDMEISMNNGDVLAFYQSIGYDVGLNKTLSGNTDIKISGSMPFLPFMFIIP